nr:MAG TPA: hypothetical protein [Caudoviricetes sp.]
MYFSYTAYIFFDIPFFFPYKVIIYYILSLFQPKTPTIH